MWSEGCISRQHLGVLVSLGLTTLLLVLSSGSVGGDSTLELSSLSNALALLRLLVMLGNLRAVVGVIVGHSLLLARHLVEALRLLAWVGLWLLVWVDL